MSNKKSVKGISVRYCIKGIYKNIPLKQKQTAFFDCLQIVITCIKY